MRHQARNHELESGQAQGSAPTLSVRSMVQLLVLVVVSLTSMVFLQSSMSVEAHTTTHVAHVAQQALVQFDAEPAGRMAAELIATVEPTIVPTTAAPTTAAPTTAAPSTAAPTTAAPTTKTPKPTTKAPTPAPTTLALTPVPIETDKYGNIYPKDPEGKKDCSVLAVGHLWEPFINETYCYTVEERRDFIRNMVYALLDALEESGIEYWLDSGTLLGAYRGKGLIPHDLDADIGLSQYWFNKLRHTQINVPARYGLFINDSPIYGQGPYWYLPGRYVDRMTGLYIDIFEFIPGKRAVTVNSTMTVDIEHLAANQQSSFHAANLTVNVQGTTNATVHVTIDTTETHDIDVLAPVKSGCWVWCKKCVEPMLFSVPVEWIYPLQRCTFDAREVWCPAQPIPYLTMLYDDDFMTPSSKPPPARLRIVRLTVVRDSDFHKSVMRVAFPTTRVPAVTDKYGNIYPKDPEGKKDCAVLAAGHLWEPFINETYCYTVEERRDFIRNMVYALLDALEANGIEYWLDSGTLLGSYREENLIPHDLDADIGLSQHWFNKLRHTQIEVPSRYGLFINDSPIYGPGPYEYLPGRYVDRMTGLYIDIFEFIPGKRTVTVNTTKVLESNVVVANGEALWTEANVSVQVHSTKNATVHITIDTIESREIDVLAPVKSGCWMYCKKCIEPMLFSVPVEWIYPLKRCTFGARELWCPAQPEPYLTMLYDDTFMTPA
ncbi:hypothetical protein ACHHYP_02391 [Achlya hypogyna]|uniref:LicD/FKTN/FKRP nucleotidyltransferase domain-containing protein n=1 Tax=Achlya hypogyna TaxID=1202772 RepID=A0A1V9Z6L1_ACHHY|nr:hypothetical protein ACHHYP_02391 [Achlya hypogyna]